MKIGIIIKNFAVGKQFDKSGVPNKSGAEFHAENHALLFKENGDSVYVMTKKTYFFTKGRELFNGIDLVRLHDPFRWLEIFIRMFTTHKNTDAFYIIGTPKFAVWIILYAQFMKIPVTLSLTSKVEIFSSQNGWRNKIFAKCNNYIAISKEIKQGLIETTSIEENKIHLLPQGIDTENRFYPVDFEQKMNLRIKYNLPTNKTVVLFCARVVENKGIETLKETWKEVYYTNQDMILLVVGGGVTKLLNELKELSLQLENSIIITGEVPKTEEYYQLSDMYILPSWYEGLSTSTMEALSCGLPCIGSDIGGINDLIIHGENGYLAKVKNSDEFAEYVLRLKNNEEMRKEFSRKARLNAEKYLDSHKLFSELNRIIKNR